MDPHARKEEGQHQNKTVLTRVERIMRNNYPVSVHANDGTHGSNNNNKASPNQNRFVTLRVTADSFRNSRMYLPYPFLKENGLFEPGMVTLLGKNGTRTMSKLLQESSGRMTIGKGWKPYARENNLEIGMSFTWQLIWENANPVFSLFSVNNSKTNRLQQGESSSSSRARRRNKNIREEMRDSLIRFVTIIPSPNDVKEFTFQLPYQFRRENGFDKYSGKITFLGKDNMKWWGYLLKKDGSVAVGIGWTNFCEANGVMKGDSFSLEFLHIEESTPVIKLLSNSLI